MLDFVKVRTEQQKSSIKVYPEFIAKVSDDLMIRGKAFYAIWDERSGFWSNNEWDVQKFVDEKILDFVTHMDEGEKLNIQLLKNFSSNKWTEWQKYCKSMPDSYHELDRKIIFSNEEVKKEDYVTRKLDYPLIEQETPAYDELMSVLYDPEERQKLEWAIGSIITGDSKEIQKFLVLYGGPGTGKSTVLNIIQDMFPGFYSLFEAKALTSNGQFGLESMKDNPLIAIQHDGDLSRIEDNSKLNSIVSHEKMTVNEKYKSMYITTFHSFLFMGTNKPVKITDSKSGILRRLIDVSPTGNKIPKKEFDDLKRKIKFEYSGIAYRCLQVYKKLGPNYYNDYIPVSMMGETNDIFNFIEDNYDFFKEEPEDGFALSIMWRRYKEYCDEAKVSYPLSMRLFKIEMKSYFREFKDRYKGKYSVYLGFLKDKFVYKPLDQSIEKEPETWLVFDQNDSGLFDSEFSECPAQYATNDEKPLKPWDSVKTKLKDLNTKKVHYVRVPEQLIIIDFDLKNEKGEKDFERNLREAEKWPRTFAELSKSGSGIHLAYWYDGNVEDLSRIFADDIEIKVFSGKSSLRRKVTKCNNIPIAHISSGLPLKERKKNMLDNNVVKSEKGLRELIKRNLRKEIHPGTKPSIDFIYKILEDAYQQGLKYDVTDMRHAIQHFALNSTHQSDYCLEMVSKMKFKSEEPSENTEFYGEDAPIVFYDVEVFKNLFLIVWKKIGEGNEKVLMYNPKPEEVEKLTKFRLVGFNNRRYDNHEIYGSMMGYSPEQLFKLSQRIISGDKDAFFGEAYNLSYTDIYDYSTKKQSLKKWEIDLGIHHQELGLPWDQPVPKELWPKVGEYCCYDVDATEGTWNATKSDFRAREILAEWAEMTVNDTTNSLTTRLIVGRDPNPQSKFIYTDLSTIFSGYRYSPYGIPKEEYLPGVKISSGKSIYMGKDPSEGGYAIGYPGIYWMVAVLDVESMHPHSAIALKVFGEEYTMNFKNIVDARLLIKHKKFEEAKNILPERLHKYLDDPSHAKDLAYALKIAINSVYGLTSASFPNKLRDPRNVDNIVAKYGALFMIALEEEVKKRGGIVVHIKTDSIKIANATSDMINFVKEFGEKYGFKFNHEATYSKMCIVNDAVYIAKYADPFKCKERYDYVPEDNQDHPMEWTATGTQFQVPYVFKTLFSKESIEFKDLCETKSVSTTMYLDMNENLPDVSEYEDILNDRKIAQAKGVMELSLKKQKRLEDWTEKTDEQLKDMISKGHDYHFVGKVGLFCPILPGCGGGVLVREGTDGKYTSVTGTKKTGKDGCYRWMEADMVKELGLEDKIDKSYYNNLVDKAIEEIRKYGDAEHFMSDDQNENDWMEIPDTDSEEEFPFDYY